MDWREKYFAEANSLRAQGQATTELQERSRPLRRGRNHESVDVGGLMQLWAGESGFGNRSGSSSELVFDDRAEGRTEKAMT